MENDVKEDLEQARQKLEQEKPTQEKECPESKEQEKQRKQKKSNRMFWGVIIGLCIVVIIAKIIAFGGSSEEAKADKPKNSLSMLKKFYLPILQLKRPA